MTTQVTVSPHGNAVEVTITENGVETKSVPNPTSSTDYYVYDTKTITVKETKG